MDLQALIDKRDDEALADPVLELLHARTVLLPSSAVAWITTVKMSEKQFVPASLIRLHEAIFKRKILNIEIVLGHHFAS
jgi:hypothetical protein